MRELSWLGINRMAAPCTIHNDSLPAASLIFLQRIVGERLAVGMLAQPDLGWDTVLEAHHDVLPVADMVAEFVAGLVKGREAQIVAVESEEEDVKGAGVGVLVKDDCGAKAVVQVAVVPGSILGGGAGGRGQEDVGA